MRGSAQVIHPLNSALYLTAFIKEVDGVKLL